MLVDRQRCEPAVLKTGKKVLTWVAIAVVVILAILLPVIIVTGIVGADSLAGTVALIGMVLLAFGVSWFVRIHDERGRG
jgi:uncharacterized membrane protein